MNYFILSVLDDQEGTIVPHNVAIVTFKSMTEHELLEAIKSAAYEYLNFKGGENYFKDNPLMMGDFPAFVPDEICLKYGFIKLPETYQTVCVSSNIVLATPDYIKDVNFLV